MIANELYEKASFRLELHRRLPRVVLDFEKSVFGYSQEAPLGPVKKDR